MNSRRLIAFFARLNIINQV